MDLQELQFPCSLDTRKVANYNQIELPHKAYAWARQGAGIFLHRRVEVDKDGNDGWEREDEGMIA